MGAGTPVEAVVRLGGAIGVRHCSYSVRRVCRAIATYPGCIGGVPLAVLCGAWGGGSRLQPGGVTGQWPSIGIRVGGGRAMQPTRCPIVQSPAQGSGLSAHRGCRGLPGGAASGGAP